MFPDRKLILMLATTKEFIYVTNLYFIISLVTPVLHIRRIIIIQRHCVFFKIKTFSSLSLQPDSILALDILNLIISSDNLQFEISMVYDIGLERYRDKKIRVFVKDLITFR